MRRITRISVIPPLYGPPILRPRCKRSFTSQSHHCHHPHHQQEQGLANQRPSYQQQGNTGTKWEGLGHAHRGRRKRRKFSFTTASSITVASCSIVPLAYFAFAALHDNDDDDEAKDARDHKNSDVHSHRLIWTHLFKARKSLFHEQLGAVSEYGHAGFRCLQQVASDIKGVVLGMTLLPCIRLSEFVGSSRFFHMPPSLSPDRDLHVDADFVSYEGKRVPTGVCMVCLLNVAVYAMWKVPSWSGFMNRNFLSSPHHLKQGRIHTLITCALSHATLLHLALNTVGILSFAPMLNVQMGLIPFLTTYMLLGGAATCGQFLGNRSLAVVSLILHRILPSSTRVAMNHGLVKRNSQYMSVLGASGIVYALLAYNIAVNPNQCRYAFVFFPHVTFTGPELLKYIAVFDGVGAIVPLLGRASPLGHFSHLSGLLLGLILARKVKQR